MPFQPVKTIRTLAFGMFAIFCGPLAFAQSTDSVELTDDDLATLQDSLNLDGSAKRSVMGVPVWYLADYGIEDDLLQGFLAIIPPLTLAEDRKTAVIEYEYSDADDIQFDGQNIFNPRLVFERISDTEYRFYLSGIPNRIEPTDQESLDQGQGIVIERLVFEGVWDTSVHAISQINFALGEAKANIEELTFALGGMEYFAGPLANYSGENDVDLHGFEASSAQVLRGGIGTIELAFQDGGQDAQFDWQGMTFEQIVGVSAGSEQLVPNILYGTTELQEAVRLHDQLPLDLGYGDQQVAMQEMSDVLKTLFQSLNAYGGIGAHSIASGLPGKLVIKDRYDPISLAFDGFELTSGSEVAVPADGEFSLRLLPWTLELSDGRISAQEIAVGAEVSDFDLTSLVGRLLALVETEGTWGDLSAIYFEMFDAAGMSVQVKGLNVSNAIASEIFPGGIGDMSAVDKDAAALAVEQMGVSFRLDDLLNPQGATLSLDYGIKGLVVAEHLVDKRSLYAEYLSDANGNGSLDIVPSDYEVALTLAGIPANAWQAQLDAAPRNVVLFDLEGIERESAMLMALGFQFLAPVLENPPVATLNQSLMSDIASLELEATYNVNPMVPPTFGAGEGTLVIEQADALLQHLLVANKRANKRLDSEDEFFDYAETSFVDDMILVEDLLRNLRTMANRNEAGDYEFIIKSDPIDLLLINGIALEDLAAQLGF